MQSGVTVLWLVGGVAALLGIALTVPILIEAYRLAHEVLSQARSTQNRRPQAGATPRKRGETGPLQQGQPRRLPAYEDRKTVKRLIDYFDDNQDNG